MTLNREPNHRMTRQRQVILDVVRADHTHPSADEIYEEARKKLPHISMGTVYRNLEVLASCGLIDKLEPGRTQMRFDGNTTRHYHLVCVNCGKIEDIPPTAFKSALMEFEHAMDTLKNHGIMDHKLEFVGLCSECFHTKQKSS